MRDLGCMYGTEPTEVHALSVRLLGSCSDPDQFQIEPSACLTKLRQFKEMFKFRHKQIYSAKHLWGVVKVFPSDPEELRWSHVEVYNNAFPDADKGPEHRPVACPLNEALLDQVRLAIPARSSHHSINVCFRHPVRGAYITEIPRNGRFYTQV